MEDGPELQLSQAKFAHMGHSFPLPLAQAHFERYFNGHIEKLSHARDKKVLKKLRRKYKWSDTVALMEEALGS